jgi:anti-sigma regulatory factor (Ser/Thr protein kinase)
MSSPAPAPARIQLASAVPETGRMHAWLDGLFAAWGAPEALAHAIRLCLEEAVMNVILHGYGPGRPGVIEISAWREPDAVFARVCDGAAPFDPLVEPGAAGPGRGAGQAGGRGLLLIRRYARSCRYERQDGRNALLLGFASPACDQQD